MSCHRCRHCRHRCNSLRLLAGTPCRSLQTMPSSWMGKRHEIQPRCRQGLARMKEGRAARRAVYIGCGGGRRAPPWPAAAAPSRC